jgi:hypothetical protein
MVRGAMHEPGAARDHRELLLERGEVVADPALEAREPITESRRAPRIADAGEAVQDRGMSELSHSVHSDDSTSFKDS